MQCVDVVGLVSWCNLQGRLVSWTARFARLGPWVLVCLIGEPIIDRLQKRNNQLVNSSHISYHTPGTYRYYFPEIHGKFGLNIHIYTNGPSSWTAWNPVQSRRVGGGFGRAEFSLRKPGVRIGRQCVATTKSEADTGKIGRW